MAPYQEYTELVVTKQDKILLITFHNPKKRNCLNRTAYKEITRVMNEVAQDDEVTLVVLTGSGDFFTAGNDLSQSAVTADDLDAFIKEGNIIFKDMARSVVDCPKVIVALVNGPAIGIGTTLVGLCDIAWCSKTAYFLTPFTQLGLVPEACSSYTFPLLLGASKAGEMLYMSEPMTAEEAYHHNFVSKVYDTSELNTVIWPKIKQFSELPPTSMQASKKLVRSHIREALYHALNIEGEELHKRFYTEEFMNAIVAFATRKNKSKL